MKALVRLLLVFATVAFLCTSSLWGQAASSLTGTVTDPTGAVIPGAEIKLTNDATGVTRTATTGPNGAYFFPQLAPATYRLEVSAQGFKTYVQRDLAVQVGLASTLNIQLEVGAMAETVEVTGAAVPLNTSDASLGVPLSGDEVRNLPSLDRNPAALLSLQPGVTFVPGSAEPGGYGGQSLAEYRSGSVSGSRSDQTNITLDGVDVNDPITGAAFTSVLRVTQDSLQEFRVSTTTYSSEGGGRSSAAQVTLVTKSGTNEFHGSAYYLHRNEAFNANDFFLNKAGVEEGKFRRHLYGASLGGPVIKNRFFLFGNWERNQESLFEAAERSVPALHMRDAVFIYQCTSDPDDDPTTPNPFAPCPATATSVTGLSGTLYNVPAGFFGLSPAQIDALDRGGPGPNLATLTAWAALPEPNSFGFNDGINLLGFRFAAPIDNVFNTWIARADFHIDPAAKHTLFWRGTLQGDRQSAAPQYPDGSPFEKNLVGHKGHAVGYTAVFSPTTVNTFRYGLTRIKESTAGNRSSEFVRHRFLDDTLGFLNQTDGTSSSFGRTIPQHHFRNDFTWSRGTHTFSFGGEARYTRNSRFSDAGSFHFIVSNPSWLPNNGGEIHPGHTECPATRPECAAVPFAVGRTVRDFMTIMIAPLSQVTANYNFDRTGATLPAGAAVRRRFAVDEYELYAQDQWRITSTLTLNYGVRYFYATPPWETNGNQVLPQPTLAAFGPNPRLSAWMRCREQAMLTGQASRQACGGLVLELGGKANNGLPYYNKDVDNWSPRLAVAWAPRFKEGFLGKMFGDGKSVLRVGYSLVYDRMGNALIQSFDAAGSFGMATSLSNGLGSCSIGGERGRPFCPRFTGYLDTAAGFAGAGPGRGLQPSPGGSFPAVPPLTLSTTTQTIDDSLRNAYSHAASLSFARELPGGLTVEAAWVGRRGLKLPIARDFAMPADLRAFGTSAFEEARFFIQAAADGVTLANIGLRPFWENLLPGFGPNGVNGGCLGFDVFNVDPGPDGLPFTGDEACGFSPTQVAYDYVMGYHGVAGSAGFGTSTVWEDIDRFRFPAMLSQAGCPGPFQVDSDGNGTFDSAPACRFAFFPGQYVQLRGLTGLARSEYSAFQLSLRKRMSRGLLFNINYTLSHSLDHSSTPERTGTTGGIGAGLTGFMNNSWDIWQQYADSDFDMRHQLNAHWVFELPLGRGRHFASGIPGWLDQIIGGWLVSGIFRANSALPLTVDNGRTWPTNWNYTPNAVCAPRGAYILGLAVGPCPATKTTKNGPRGPNVFADPDEAFLHFRHAATGESGGRNQMRGDKYLNFDLGIAKSFRLPKEGHRLHFRWDMFNFLNSAYFDTGALNASKGDQGTFGDYIQVLGGPRRMQLTLRYEF